MELALLPDLLPRGAIGKLIEHRLEYEAVFVILMGEDVYAFRPLTKGEFKSLQPFAEWAVDEVDDAIVNYGLLWPECPSGELPYGAHAILSYWIAVASGFAKPDDLANLLATERVSKDALDAQYDAYIATAFRITPAQTDNLNAFQISKLIARGEIVTQGEFKIYTEEEIATLNKEHERLETKKQKFEDKLDARAERAGKLHKRHRADGKFIAPGGSPEEQEAVKQEKENIAKSQEFLDKRGIKRKVLSKELQKMVDKGNTEAAYVDAAEDAVIAYYRRNKDRSNSGIDYSTVESHGR